jgi:hypothetical protein
MFTPKEGQKKRLPHIIMNWVPMKIIRKGRPRRSWHEGDNNEDWTDL